MLRALFSPNGTRQTRSTAIEHGFESLLCFSIISKKRDIAFWAGSFTYTNKEGRAKNAALYYATTEQQIQEKTYRH